MTDQEREQKIKEYEDRAAQMYEAGRVDLAHEALEKMNELIKGRTRAQVRRMRKTKVLV